MQIAVNPFQPILEDNNADALNVRGLPAKRIAFAKLEPGEVYIGERFSH